MPAEFGPPFLELRRSCTTSPESIAATPESGVGSWDLALGDAVAEQVLLPDEGAMQPTVGVNQELATNYSTQNQRRPRTVGQREQQPSIDNFWVALSIPNPLL